MLSNYVNILGQELIEVSAKVIAFLPHFIVGIIVLLLGWLFGVILGRAVEHVFQILKIDHLSGKIGMSRLSHRSGHQFSLGSIFGELVKWTIFIAFAFAAADIFGLYYVSSFLVSILQYIPSVFVAGIILVVGRLLANFCEKVIDGSVRASGLKVSFAGTFARYAIMVTAILAAINELGIIRTFTNALFIGIIGALALAFGLAFGLGGRDAASRAISRLEKDFTKEKDRN